MSKHVLLITYFFPPAANAGVRRVFQFAKYLENFNWTPTVLTVRTKDYRQTHDTKTYTSTLPSAVEVQRTRCIDPYNVLCRKRAGHKPTTSSWHTIVYWIRANIFIPDAYIGWIPFAVARGLRILRKKNIDAIVTSGPPHSAHLVGLALSKWYNIPWIADFRDPWDFAFYERRLEHRLTKRFDRLIERSILKHASQIVSVTQHLNYTNRAGQRMPYVIPNGYDPADFKNRTATIDTNTFILSHIGTMHYDYDVQPLLQAMQALHSTDTCPQLRTEFIGHVHQNALQNLQQTNMAVRPHMHHQKAIQHMCNSALLLLFLRNESYFADVVPSKLYEYLASGRPILVIGPKHSRVAHILQSTHAGALFEPSEHRAICAFIQKHYDAWQHGQPLRGTTLDHITQYSRISQTKSLANQLDALV